MTWQVQNLLGVVFTPPAPSAADALKLWTKIVGEGPDQFNRHAPGSTAVGLFEGDTLTITTQPGRIDVTLSPPDGDPNLPPVYDDFDGPLSRLRRLGQFVAREENPIRVAVVANCVKFVPTSADAVAVFVENTHLPGLPPHAMDLNFAMNVRKRLGAAGWEMNRVVRWGTAKFQMFQFAMGGASMQVPQVHSERELATMMIDVNSVARGALPIGGKQASSAFEEFELEVRSLISGGYDALINV